MKVVYLLMVVIGAALFGYAVGDLIAIDHVAPHATTWDISHPEPGTTCYKPTNVSYHWSCVKDTP